jgi:hypothetical protein
MELPIGFKLLAVEAKVTTDHLGLVGHQGVAMGPTTRQGVALDHGEQEDSGGRTGSPKAMTAMQMGDLDPGTRLSLH